MNYFEFYDIPVAFQIDEDLLKRKYYELSRSFHPDFHTLASEDQQESALDKSTTNNQAFKTLSNFDERLKYILGLFGKLKEEGENKVPQDFLMEMMEINESLMELEMDPSEEAQTTLIKQIKEIERETYQDIAPILDQEINSLSERDWQSVSDFYLKSRYLKRLQENVDKLAAEH
ncbi:MAG: Fe-S protein assembly co-chaperone HscB [Saprospiraceae bacterium]|nr:Fe-S protein assembly co-chaperone HscB [Saprospiraceae bacterium]